MKEQIKEYYNKLAKNYDDSRFGNSYGRFINSQEVQVLDQYLSKNEGQINLDLACGTGRFLEYASHGIDISDEMLQIAKSKYLHLDLRLSEADNLPFQGELFDNVISFHLMMHLDSILFEKILIEVSRVTKKEGYFIFDIPSMKRRKLTKYSANSWHGGHQFSVNYLKECISNQWELVDYTGVSFLPLHRIPKSYRQKIMAFDNYMCRSFLKEYSSYLIFILQRK